MEWLSLSDEKSNYYVFRSRLIRINTVVNMPLEYFSGLGVRKSDFTDSELNEIYDLIEEFFWKESSANYAKMIHSIDCFSAENFILQFDTFLANNFQFNWLVKLLRIKKRHFLYWNLKSIWISEQSINKDLQIDESNLIKNTFTRLDMKKIRKTINRQGEELWWKTKKLMKEQNKKLCIPYKKEVDLILEKNY